ncbi:MAG: hypothetical protein KatS3mg110_0665 [Pirellulaceae bacterium]|nr:MAG: hypothetical protein KatS3mg110_0665 [Pirellulaceae bacterium]
MAVATRSVSPRRGGVKSPHTSVSLRVTAYDKVAAWLVALLVLVGLTATVLFIIWLTTVLVFHRVAKPIQMIQYPGRGDHAAGFERDPEPPGLEEIDLQLEQPSLEASLEAVTDLASTVAASLDTFATDSLLTAHGTGRGDSRPPGPEGEGDDVIPPWERWEIRYAAGNLEEYARQLDFFGIELGAVGGSKFVDYAYQLSRNPPSRRQGSGKDEKRVYLTWRTGSLREFDEQLLARAGIPTAGRIVMQFLPEAVYNELHRLEFENAQGRPPQEWLRTIFGVRPARGGYEFYIISQTFRPPPR